MSDDRRAAAPMSQRRLGVSQQRNLLPGYLVRRQRQDARVVLQEHEAPRAHVANERPVPWVVDGLLVGYPRVVEASQLF